MVVLSKYIVNTLLGTQLVTNPFARTFSKTKYYPYPQSLDNSFVKWPA